MRILISLLIVFTVNGAFAGDFKNNNWGDSRKSVVSKEGKKALKNEKHYVIFPDILDGNPVFITYFFDKANTLKNATYFFREKKKNRNAYVFTYNDLKKYFVSQYGSPQKDSTIWHDQKLKGQAKKIGEAIAQGHLEYYTKWTIQKTIIEFKLSQWNGQPRITLIYKPKTTKMATKAVDLAKVNLDNKSAKSEKIAVLFFELKAVAGFKKEVAKVLGNIILSELYNYKKFNVISKKDIQKLFGDDEIKTIDECNDNTCLLEISGALGMDILISGEIGKLGSISQLSLRMLDNENGTVYSSASKTIKGNEEILVSETKATVLKLLSGYDPSYKPLKLKVDPPVSSAKEDVPKTLEKQQSYSESIFQSW